MKAGTEDKKKLIAAGALGLLAIGAVGYNLIPYFFGSSTPPPQVAPVIVTRPAGAVAAGPATSGSAVKVGSVSTQLDPTLHMEAMEATEDLVYSGTGRNIFEAGPSAAEIAERTPKPQFPIHPNLIPGPMTVSNPGPPPKPPINLKFFGIATQDGKKRALLLSGDDVFLASAGDIVERRYKVVSISVNSILVEDVPNSNRQSLPLLAN